jgi:hypothetical protein
MSQAVRSNTKVLEKFWRGNGKGRIVVGMGRGDEIGAYAHCDPRGVTKIKV